MIMVYISIDEQWRGMARHATISRSRGEYPPKWH
jgi:hypothetical protein